MIPRVFYLAAFDVSRGTASNQILDRLLFFRTFQNIPKINASANQAGFDSTDRNTQHTSNIDKRRFLFMVPANKFPVVRGSRRSASETRQLAW
jgi:hypothetical protein